MSSEAAVVTSGNIVLSEEKTEVIAGLNFRALIKMSPPDVGASLTGGTSVGSIKRIDKMHLNLTETVGMKVGKDESNLEEIIFRTADLLVEDPIPPFTGVKVHEFEGDYGVVVAPVLVQDLPLPMRINSITLEGITYD